MHCASYDLRGIGAFTVSKLHSQKNNQGSNFDDSIDCWEDLLYLKKLLKRTSNCDSGRNITILRIKKYLNTVLE